MVSLGEGKDVIVLGDWIEAGLAVKIEDFDPKADRIEVIANGNPVVSVVQIKEDDYAIFVGGDLLNSIISSSEVTADNISIVNDS